MTEELEPTIANKTPPAQPRDEGLVSLDPQSSSGPSTSRLEKLSSRSIHALRYESQGEIARGGMGAILRVWDEDLRRNIAMKVILDQGADLSLGSRSISSDVLQRFLDEAQISAQLDHPGVIPVHELGVNQRGQAYFTMRLVKGENLRSIFDLVREGRAGWTRTRALELIVKVCDTIAFAHSKNVIHRDLKPENIMVGKFGELYVMDWGLAKLLGQADRRNLRLRADNTRTLTRIRTDGRSDDESSENSPLVTMDGSVLGTPAFMPPEQAEGRIEELGPRSDIYSIGAMLYHLLSGHPPYLKPGARISPRTLLAQVLNGPPQPLQDIDRSIPAELIAICEKAMARLPSGRYASAQDLAEDLRAFLDHRVVRAYRTGAVVELRKWVGRNKHLALATAGALLAVVAGLIVSLLFYAEARTKESDARDQARIAQQNESLAIASREMLQQTSDPLLLASLIERMAKPWPTKTGEAVHDYEVWRREASELLARFPEHRSRVTTMEPSTRRERLETMLSQASALARLLVVGEQRQQLISQYPSWQRVQEDLRDKPGFAGIERLSLEGLVPLGINQATGLWELWFCSSGSAPIWDARGGAAGTVQVTDATPLVFVLVPGGRIDQGGAIDLDPFLISKFEMTNVQWDALGGKAILAEDVDARIPTEPVGYINWFDSYELLDDHGLSLPTEAQWEYACRAGTTTPYWSGSDEAALALVGWYRGNSPDDPQPVGGKPANAFGLHDVHGNALEWCQDEKVHYEQGQPRPGDGLRLDPQRIPRVDRGGSVCSGHDIDMSRSEFRDSSHPGIRSAWIGLRPAKALKP